MSCASTASHRRTYERNGKFNIDKVLEKKEGFKETSGLRNDDQDIFELRKLLIVPN